VVLLVTAHRASPLKKFKFLIILSIILAIILLAVSLQLLSLVASLTGVYFMRVHHLNCISSCPLGGKLMDGVSASILERGHLTNHCLLIETNSELVLIDTGFGMQEVLNPHSRLSEFFLQQLKPDFREELTAIRQIQNLGFDPRDVRHIVLTHLDFDHAGGLDDFPEAKVHMMQIERDYAFQQSTWLDRQRFRPQQWGTKDNWKVYSPGDGETWFGFNKVQALEGLPPEIVMVPLVGHTFGHVGVAVKPDNKWLFNTGDAYFYHEEMNHTNPYCTPGLTAYQLLMDKDHKLRVWNQERLRILKENHKDEVDIFCSHDVIEFEKLSGRSPEIPIDKIMAHHIHQPTHHHEHYPYH
jgi:glyoxylase-like metal-dependent hydrolase (beta-lactamase superfamily II)